MEKNTKPKPRHVIKVHSPHPVTITGETKAIGTGSGKTPSAVANSKVVGTSSIKGETSAKPLVCTPGNVRTASNGSHQNDSSQSRIKTFRTQLFNRTSLKKPPDRKATSNTQNSPRRGFLSRNAIPNRDASIAPTSQVQRPALGPDPCPRLARGGLNSKSPANKNIPPRVIDEARSNMRQKKMRLTAGQSPSLDSIDQQKGQKNRLRECQTNDESDEGPHDGSLPFGYLAVARIDGSMFQDDGSFESSEDCSFYEKPGRSKKPSRHPTKKPVEPPDGRRRASKSTEGHQSRLRGCQPTSDRDVEPHDESQPFGGVSVNQHESSSIFRDDNSDHSSEDCALFEKSDCCRKPNSRPIKKPAESNPSDERRNLSRGIEETRRTRLDKGPLPERTELTNEEYIERLKATLKAMRPKKSSSDRSFLSDSEGYDTDIKEELKQMKEDSHTWSLDSYMDAFPDFEFKDEMAVDEKRVKGKEGMAATKDTGPAGIEDLITFSPIEDITDSEQRKISRTLDARQAVDRSHAPEEHQDLERLTSLETRNDSERRRDLEKRREPSLPMTESDFLSSSSRICLRPSSKRTVTKEADQYDEEHDLNIPSTQIKTGNGVSSKRGSKKSAVREEDYDADNEDLSSEVGTIPEVTSKHQAVLSEILEQLHETQEVLNEFEQSLQSKSAMLREEARKEIDVQSSIALDENRATERGTEESKIKKEYASSSKLQQVCTRNQVSQMLTQETSQISSKKSSDFPEIIFQEPESKTDSRKAKRSAQPPMSETREDHTAASMPSKQDELIEALTQKFSRIDSASPSMRFTRTSSTRATKGSNTRQMSLTSRDDTLSPEITKIESRVAPTSTPFELIRKASRSSSTRATRGSESRRMSPSLKEDTASLGTSIVGRRTAPAAASTRILHETSKASSARATKGSTSREMSSFSKDVSTARERNAQNQKAPREPEWIEMEGTLPDIPAHCRGLLQQSEHEGRSRRTIGRSKIQDRETSRQHSRLPTEPVQRAQKVSKRQPISQKQTGTPPKTCSKPIKISREHMQFDTKKVPTRAPISRTEAATRSQSLSKPRTPVQPCQPTAQVPKKSLNIECQKGSQPQTMSRTQRASRPQPVPETQRWLPMVEVPRPLPIPRSQIVKKPKPGSKAPEKASDKSKSERKILKMQRCKEACDTASFSSTTDSDSFVVPHTKAVEKSKETQTPDRRYYAETRSSRKETEGRTTSRTSKGNHNKLGGGKDGIYSSRSSSETDSVSVNSSTYKIDQLAPLVSSATKMELKHAHTSRNGNCSSKKNAIENFSSRSQPQFQSLRSDIELGCDIDIGSDDEEEGSSAILPSDTVSRTQDVSSPHLSLLYQSTALSSSNRVLQLLSNAGPPECGRPNMTSGQGFRVAAESKVYHQGRPVVIGAMSQSLSSGAILYSEQGISNIQSFPNYSPLCPNADTSTKKDTRFQPLPAYDGACNFSIHSRISPNFNRSRDSNVRSQPWSTYETPTRDFSPPQPCPNFNVPRNTSQPWPTCERPTRDVSPPQPCPNFNVPRNTSQPWPTYERPTRDVSPPQPCPNFNVPRNTSQPWPTYERPTRDVSPPQPCPNFNVPRNTSQPWPTYERPARRISLPKPCPNVNVSRHKYDSSQPFPTHGRLARRISLPKACPNANVPRHKYDNPRSRPTCHVPAANMDGIVKKNRSVQHISTSDIPEVINSQSRLSINLNGAIDGDENCPPKPPKRSHVNVDSIRSQFAPKFQSTAVKEISLNDDIPVRRNRFSDSSRSSHTAVYNDRTSIPLPVYNPLPKNYSCRKSCPNLLEPVKENFSIQALAPQDVPHDSEENILPLSATDESTRCLQEPAAEDNHIHFQPSYDRLIDVDEASIVSQDEPVDTHEYILLQPTPQEGLVDVYGCILPPTVSQNMAFDANGYILPRPVSEDWAVNPDGYVCLQPAPAQAGAVDAGGYLLPRTIFNDSDRGPGTTALKSSIQENTYERISENYYETIPNYAPAEVHKCTFAPIVDHRPVGLHRHDSDFDESIPQLLIKKELIYDSPGGHSSFSDKSGQAPEQTIQRPRIPTPLSRSRHGISSANLVSDIRYGSNSDSKDYITISDSTPSPAKSYSTLENIAVETTENLMKYCLSEKLASTETNESHLKYEQLQGPNASPELKVYQATPQACNVEVIDLDLTPNEASSELKVSQATPQACNIEVIDLDLTSDKASPELKVSQTTPKACNIEVIDLDLTPHEASSELKVSQATPQACDIEVIDLDLTSDKASPELKVSQATPQACNIEVIDLDLTPNENFQGKVIERTNAMYPSEDLAQSVQEDKTTCEGKSVISTPTVSSISMDYSDPSKADDSYCVEKNPEQRATKLEECSRMCVAYKVRISDRNRLLADLDKDPHFLALAYHLTGFKSLKTPLSKLMRQDKEQLVDELIKEFSETEGRIVNPLQQLQEEVKANQDEV